MNVVAVPALALVPTWRAAAILIVAERTCKALRGTARDASIKYPTEDGGAWLEYTQIVNATRKLMEEERRTRETAMFLSFLNPPM